MPAIANSVPSEILYHFVTKHQSVEELYNSLYVHPAEITKKHFMTVNSHLDQQVRPNYRSS